MREHVFAWFCHNKRHEKSPETTLFQGFQMMNKPNNYAEQIIPFFTDSSIFTPKYLNASSV